MRCAYTKKLNFFGNKSVSSELPLCTTGCIIVYNLVNVQTQNINIFFLNHTKLLSQVFEIPTTYKYKC